MPDLHADISNVTELQEPKIIETPALTRLQMEYGDQLIRWGAPKIAQFLGGLKDLEITVLCAWLLVGVFKGNADCFVAFGSYLNFFEKLYERAEQIHEQETGEKPTKIILLRSNNPVRPDAGVAFGRSETDLVQ